MNEVTVLALSGYADDHTLVGGLPSGALPISLENPL